MAPLSLLYFLLLFFIFIRVLIRTFALHLHRQLTKESRDDSLLSRRSRFTAGINGRLFWR
jgi:hypothetical protein